jgi:accessory colonization factor AcfC
MTVDVMGAKWTLVERTREEDRRLDGNDGYCDWTTKQIVLARDIGGAMNDLDSCARQVKRREIVHAFLKECGLSEHSCEAQPQSDALVDWFATVGPRIYRAWIKVEAI